MTRRSKEWTVVVERDGKEVVLKPKQLVLATGMSGKPNMPDIQGQDDLQGRAAPFLASIPGPDAYAGKKVVVIGSNNSAHDICAALWEAGADVTMVQRSSTHIVRSDSLMEIGLGALYSEQAVAAGITTREGRPDLRLAALPDHARVPDPGLRQDARARRRFLRGAREGAASCSTGATTSPACS